MNKITTNDKVFSNLFFIKEQNKDLTNLVNHIQENIEQLIAKPSSVCPKCGSKDGRAYGTNWKGNVKYHLVCCQKCKCKFERAFAVTRIINGKNK